MSIPAMNWAWKKDGLSPSEKLVLMCLADHANDAGECWPSQSVIAKRCGLSRETVNKCLKKIRDTGIVIVQHQSDENGKSANRYFLQLNHDVKNSHIGCDETSQPDVTNDHTPCDETSHRTVIEPKEEDTPPCIPPQNQPGLFDDEQPSDDGGTRSTGEDGTDDGSRIVGQVGGDQVEPPGSRAADKPAGKGRKRKPESGTHWRPEWWTNEYTEACHAEFVRNGYSDREADQAVEALRNDFDEYWSNGRGRRETKVDWRLTAKNRARSCASEGRYRNWRSVGNSQASSGQRQPSPGGVLGAIARRREKRGAGGCPGDGARTVGGTHSEAPANPGGGRPRIGCDDRGSSNDPCGYCDLGAGVLVEERGQIVELFPEDGRTLAAG